MDLNSYFLGVLFDAIIAKCKDTAVELPRLKEGDGAIRVTFIPQNDFGRSLIRSMSKFADRYEVVSKISESGNFVLNRPTEPCDSYSKTAMQIADYLREREIGDNKDKFRDSEHGYAPSHGVLSFGLLHDYQIFGLLLISVDGGIPEENDIVVKTSEEVLSDWCQLGPKNALGKRLSYTPN